MVAKAPVPGNWVGGVRDRGRECVCEREKERRGGGERERRGYEPFALHAPRHWAILEKVIKEGTQWWRRCPCQAAGL